MIKNFSDFSDDVMFESLINESIIYFSPRMRDQLNRTNNDISKRLLEIEGTDLKNVDITFIDTDEEGDVSFITMANAMKLIKDKYPQATNADLDVSGNKDIADVVFHNDINTLRAGRSNGDTGVYIKSRNIIKIGKLVNRIFKGTLTSSDVEKFVNDFKASSVSRIEKIDIVSGESIRHWYNEENYLEKRGSLGSSCMANKPGKFFNIYAENPDTCSLVIMTIGDKLVARALLWKLNTIEGDGVNENNRPEYFLDRVYSVEDYQIEKIRRFALDKGWSIRKYNSGYERQYIYWGPVNNTHGYRVSMSVKVKKSNYDNTFPYMDTFLRYDHFNGMLWNDENRRKGGHILQSTQGSYQESIPKRQVYINRFKDFFKKNND